MRRGWAIVTQSILRPPPGRIRPKGSPHNPTSLQFRTPIFIPSALRAGRPWAWGRAPLPPGGVWSRRAGRIGAGPAGCGAGGAIRGRALRVTPGSGGRGGMSGGLSPWRPEGVRGAVGRLWEAGSGGWVFLVACRAEGSPGGGEGRGGAFSKVWARVTDSPLAGPVGLASNAQRSGQLAFRIAQQVHTEVSFRFLVRYNQFIINVPRPGLEPGTN